MILALLLSWLSVVDDCHGLPEPDPTGMRYEVSRMVRSCTLVDDPVCTLDLQVVMVPGAVLMAVVPDLPDPPAVGEVTWLDVRAIDAAENRSDGACE